MITRRHYLQRSTKPLPKRKVQRVPAKDTSMLPLGRKKPARSELYLSFIRQQACILRHRGFCDGTDTEPHHTGPHGLGSKGPDTKTLPCCRKHHEQYHAIGRQAFERMYNVDVEWHIKRLNAEFERMTGVAA